MCLHFVRRTSKSGQVHFCDFRQTLYRCDLPDDEGTNQKPFSCLIVYRLAISKPRNSRTFRLSSIVHLSLISRRDLSHNRVSATACAITLWLNRQSWLLPQSTLLFSSVEDALIIVFFIAEIKLNSLFSSYLACPRIIYFQVPFLFFRPLFLRFLKGGFHLENFFFFFALR